MARRSATLPIRPLSAKDDKPLVAVFDASIGTPLTVRIAAAHRCHTAWSRSRPWFAVAPEVAARIVARSADGDSPVAIGRDLHLTLLEVREVLRAAELDRRSR